MTFFWVITDYSNICQVIQFSFVLLYFAKSKNDHWYVLVDLAALYFSLRRCFLQALFRCALVWVGSTLFGVISIYTFEPLRIKQNCRSLLFYKYYSSEVSEGYNSKSPCITSLESHLKTLKTVTFKWYLNKIILVTII